MNRLSQNDFLYLGYSLTRVVNAVFVAKMRSLGRRAAIGYLNRKKSYRGMEPL